ncbi:Mobile element protein [Candidatus Enterovibrio escicola]|uniref:Mobile element protein n=1 Tax=Candidatus Enterovibrio escicola TaxID=1927127 RepID=A0A2A5T483_9GAMM|nr:Mobile element protein [Candidatus Enterovibrio escacola]
MKNDKLTELEKDRVYHKCSLAETEIFRYKELLSPKLTLRDYNVHVGETLKNVK